MRIEMNIMVRGNRYCLLLHLCWAFSKTIAKHHSERGIYFFFTLLRCIVVVVLLLFIIGFFDYNENLFIIVWMCFDFLSILPFSCLLWKSNKIKATLFHMTESMFFTSSFSFFIKFSPLKYSECEQNLTKRKRKKYTSNRIWRFVLAFFLFALRLVCNVYWVALSFRFRLKPFNWSVGFGFPIWIWSCVKNNSIRCS